MFSDPKGECIFKLGLGLNKGKDRGLGFVADRAVIYAEKGKVRFTCKEANAADITVTDIVPVAKNILEIQLQDKMPGRVEKDDVKKELSSDRAQAMKRAVEQFDLIMATKKKQIEQYKPIQKKESLLDRLKGVTLVRYKDASSRENYLVTDVLKDKDILLFAWSNAFEECASSPIIQLVMQERNGLSKYGKIVFLTDETVDVIKTWQDRYDPEHQCTFIADWGSECLIKMGHSEQSAISVHIVADGIVKQTYHNEINAQGKYDPFDRFLGKSFAELQHLDIAKLNLHSSRMEDDRKRDPANACYRD
jgi:peroxiredoxin